MGLKISKKTQLVFCRLFHSFFCIFLQFFYIQFIFINILLALNLLLVFMLLFVCLFCLTKELLVLFYFTLLIPFDLFIRSPISIYHHPHPRPHSNFYSAIPFHVHTFKLIHPHIGKLPILCKNYGYSLTSIFVYLLNFLFLLFLRHRYFLSFSYSFTIPSFNLNLYHLWLLLCLLLVVVGTRMLVWFGTHIATSTIYLARKKLSRNTLYTLDRVTCIFLLRMCAKPYSIATLKKVIIIFVAKFSLLLFISYPHMLVSHAHLMLLFDV